MLPFEYYLEITSNKFNDQLTESKGQISSQAFETEFDLLKLQP